MDSISFESIEELLNIGIALSNTHEIDSLLDMILSESRRLTNADAGTLYLVDGDELRAKIAQCQTFVDRWGSDTAKSLFKSFSLPINEASICGCAALKHKVINIEDVQKINDGNQHNQDFDLATKYSTHSVLAVPMLNPDDEVIGVLQLINAQKNNEICAFDELRVKLAMALASQAAVAIQNTLLTNSLQKAHLDTLQRLGLAAEWRDKETANHIARVSHYSAIIAKQLGWDKKRIDLLFHASPMHDVGKLGIPDDILHKNGKLTPEERKTMEAHPIIGANILKKASSTDMQMARTIALSHHEKWDGSGYPQGISGEDIPIEARVVALADVYDALSSKRCYKEAFPHVKVMSIIHEETGKHFDPQVVAAFIAELDTILEIHEKYKDNDDDFAKFRSYQQIIIEE